MEASSAVIVPGRRLGKKPPKFDRRTIRLARYVDLDTFGRVPKTHNNSHRCIAFPGFAWGMMRNDDLGDCTCAAPGHARQVWSGGAHTPTDAAVVALYDEVNGGVDEGANMIDVLNKMLKAETALEQDTIIGYAAIDSQNEKLNRIAQYLFGGVYVGVNLPVNAQRQKTWDLVAENGNEPGSWGGHAVWEVDITKIGPVYVTWGGLQQATWAWHFRYCDEQYAVLDDNYLNAHGRTPQGFRLRKLKNDIAKLRAA